MAETTDMQQDLNLIRQEVMPALEYVMQVVEVLKQRQENLEDTVSKIVNGFSDAATSAQKSRLLQELQGKYGEKITPYSGMYSDLYGSDLLDDISTQMIGFSDDSEKEGFINSLLDTLNTKFGKYIQPTTKEPEIIAEPESVEVKKVSVTPTKGLDDKAKKETEALAKAMGVRK